MSDKQPTPAAIAFNGKFLAVPPTGVHRVASELIRAVGEQMSAGAAPAGMTARVIVPGNADMSAFPHHFIPVNVCYFLSGFAKNVPWEHVTLPWNARREMLVNLCNLGPVYSARAITMIHDAQVHISPDSYSATFRRWYRLVQPIVAKRSTIILTVSQYSREQLIKYGIARADEIEVILNGCDHILRIEPDNRIFERVSMRLSRFVLALASTQTHKNIGVLLKAFASSELSDVTLVLFGSATRSDFEAAGYTVPASVQFSGRVSDGELVSLMRGASAFACPSTTEGFGLPPLEAMALGCPVIIAPCGALPEVCGDAALSAPPGDASAWAACIRTIAENSEIADDLRERGLARANDFTWARAARQLLEILIR